jgi:hypothetical protein
VSADVEGAIQAALQAKFPTDRAVTEFPNALVAAVPCHRVNRVGGGRKLTLQHARVSIETVALTRRDARAAAEKVADWMTYQLPGTRAGSASITRVTCDSGPVAIPYANPDVRMVTTSYTVHTLTVPN